MIYRHLNKARIWGKRRIFASNVIFTKQCWQKPENEKAVKVRKYVFFLLLTKSLN